MTDYATFTEVETAYEGTIPSGAQARVESLITRASARLKALVPSIEIRMASGDLDLELPKGAVIEAVLRAYRNPAGATQQGVGPFQLSLNSRAQTTDAIMFTPEELALLAPMPDNGGVGVARMGIPTSVAVAPALDADGRWVYTPEQLRRL